MINLLAEGQGNHLPNFNYKIATPVGIVFNKIGQMKISYVQHLFFNILQTQGWGDSLARKSTCLQA